MKCITVLNVTVGNKSAPSAAGELKTHLLLQIASGSHLSCVVKVSWKLEILLYMYIIECEINPLWQHLKACQKSQANQIQCLETIMDLTWTRAGHRKQSQRHEKKVSLIDKKTQNSKQESIRSVRLPSVRWQIKRVPCEYFVFDHMSIDSIL